MKRMVLVILTLFCISAPIGSEQFIVEAPVKKKRGINQLKQEIGSRYADILRQESLLIESQARLQQLLYNRMEQLIATDEELLKGVTQNDLEQVLSELDTIYTHNEGKLVSVKEHQRIAAQKSFKRSPKPKVG